MGVHIFVYLHTFTLHPDPHPDPHPRSHMHPSSQNTRSLSSLLHPQNQFFDGGSITYGALAYACVCGLSATRSFAQSSSELQDTASESDEEKSFRRREVWARRHFCKCELLGGSVNVRVRVCKGEKGNRKRGGG